VVASAQAGTSQLSLTQEAAELRTSTLALAISRAVRVAIAVNEDGKREVLGAATGPSEAETFLTDFLRSLADRGLRGVKLVIADDHEWLRAAARRVFDASASAVACTGRGTRWHAPSKSRTAVAAMPTIFA
jgi:putative transposase